MGIAINCIQWIIYFLFIYIYFLMSIPANCDNHYIFHSFYKWYLRKYIFVFLENNNFHQKKQWKFFHTDISVRFITLAMSIIQDANFGMRAFKLLNPSDKHPFTKWRDTYQMRLFSSTRSTKLYSQRFFFVKEKIDVITFIWHKRVKFSQVYAVYLF